MNVHWQSPLMDSPYCGKGLDSHSSTIITTPTRSQATCSNCNPSAIDDTACLHGDIELQIPHLRFSYKTVCKLSYIDGRTTKNPKEINCSNCLKIFVGIQEYYCKRCKCPLFDNVGFNHDFDLRDSICDKTECILSNKIEKFKVLRNEIKALFKKLEDSKKKEDDLLTDEDIQDMINMY